MLIKKKVKKKLLFLILFILGLSIFLVIPKKVIDQERYNSIIINFREDIPTTTLSKQIEKISNDYNATAILNSVYSIDENIYIVEGGKTLLKDLKFFWKSIV